ncbi:MAG TPA: FAD-dependent oxidoreductase [Pyrinomonadaceae bacterium]|nr:FAD-dependent oxidoreductase [Pyrinomonadaceae bacterium]
MGRHFSRRSFLKRGAVAAAGLSLWPTGALTAGQEKLERRGPAKKVVIIGAGLAGLSAAYELTRGGHDVTVLEARTRPGGRCYTLREPFSDGLYAEAGATWIAGNHDLTLGYAKHFGLELEDYWPADELDSVRVVRGRRVRTGDGAFAQLYNLTPEEKEQLQQGGLWRKYVVPALRELGDPASAEWSAAALKKYDALSFVEFLRRQGASADAVAMMTLGWLWGDGPETVSALTVLRDSVLLRGSSGGFKVRGGNDLLPRAFAAKLQDRIRYGSPVVQVAHDAQGVRVTFLQAGTPHTIAAERLVCAVPFSVLRAIHVTPPFTAAKTRAVRELPYFSASRVYLQSRRRFWIEQKLDGFAKTDLPAVNEVWDMTTNAPGPRGILHSYITGPQARRVARMPEQQRINFVLAQMERVYPGIREHFEGGASKCWDEDPWSRGASSWYRPGQMAELWPHVARAEGRVHFAGDHTSPWIRWQQGALHSGLRVAREINESKS